MTFSFAAQKRGKEKVESLRATGFIPAVLYGPTTKPQSLTLPYNTFVKFYSEAGESSLVDLIVGSDKPVKVLIQDLQYDPVKGKIVHVDFRQINMNKEMHVNIELHFVGEAPAVKEFGGTLMKTHDTLEIKCLPQDLISHIDVDLSVLKTFTDVIRVKDLAVPAGIKVANAAELVLAKVLAPLTEEELKAMEETTAPSLEQIEVEKKGKEEVAEGEEGAAPAAGAPAVAPKKEEKKK